MAVPANLLQAVQTYQKSMLARLLNEYCFIGNVNTRFKDFNTKVAQLGSTVTYDLPPRMVSNSGLVVTTFNPIQQRVETLTVGATDSNGNATSQNVNFAVSAEQLIFNIDNNDYREPLEKSAVAELGTAIETNVASNILGSAYRFYGDAASGLTSFNQLSMAIAYFRNYGSAPMDYEGYLDDIGEAQIVGSGLTQFTPDRNNEMAQSWEVGNYNRTKFFRSNLLPTQTAGTVGNTNLTLTVTAITTQADGGITALTFSGADDSDANAIAQNDSFQFQDGVSGQINVRYRTFIGHAPSKNTVQFLSTAQCASGGTGIVTVPIFPVLYSAVGLNQNITTPITVGMQVKVLPSHRAGLLCSGKPLFMAMPMLPDQSPFATSNEYDPETGVSLRFTQGAAFGLDTYGFILDAIWGVSFVPEYCMKLVFPI